MNFRKILKKNILVGTFAKLRYVLPKEFKRKSLTVFLLLLLNSALELAGLGAMVPLFLAILQKEAFEKGWLKEVYEFSGFASTDSFILFLSLLILIFIILKNICSLLITRYQARFSFSLYRYFATHLHKYFYSKGYLFFSSKNSNEIVRDINLVPLLFSQNLILSFLGLLTEISVLLMIVISITIYDPKLIFMLLLIVVPVFFIFYQSVKNQITNLAIEANKIQSETNKNLYQSIFGFVDVVINNNQSWFFDEYKKNVSRMSQIRTKQFVYNLMPSKVIETAMILGVLVIISYGIIMLPSREELLVLLGIFALAAYRILPSVNRMMLSVMNMKSYQFTIGVVEQANKLIENNEKDEEIEFNSSITLDNLLYSYPGKNNNVIKNINLEVLKGQSIGLIGRSGSGKTTLVNILLGFLEPTNGNIFIDGKKLNTETLISWRKHVGYVQQDVFLIDGTLGENIALGYREIDYDKVIDVTKRASLYSLVNDLPNGIDTLVGERGARLSGGQRQRVGIARALYSGATVLFFDEATSALDNETEEEITEAINNLSGSNLTMFIIAHRHSTLRYCDRIIEVENGELKELPILKK